MSLKDKQRTRATRIQQKQNRLAKQLQHNELMAQAEVKAEADAPELEDETKSLELDEKCMDVMPAMAYGGATTFADAFAAMEADEAAMMMHKHTGMFQDIVRNILNNDSISDKAEAIAAAADELKGIMNKPEGEGMKEYPVVNVKTNDDIDVNKLAQVAKLLQDDSIEISQISGVSAKTLNELDDLIDETTEAQDVVSNTHKSIMQIFGDWLKAKLSRASINDLPDSDFAYIEPGGKKDESGKTTPRSLRHYPIHDEAHVRNALARAAQMMKRGGEAATIAKKAMPKIREMAKKMKIGMMDEKKEDYDGAFSTFKDAEGQYHWIGIVTNKFRDRDTRRHPKGEIVTEAAHKEFMAYLDAHPEQAPELWTWHTPGTARKSRAYWWDYDDKGFVVMSGPLTEDEAKAFDENESLGMSHGFYALERDEKQGLILKYRTFEVSELPPQFVANEWTDFAAIRKELTMAFTPDKRAALVKRFGEAKVAELEGKTGEMAKALEAIGAEWKDTQSEAPKTEPPTAEAKSETVEHVLAALNLPELQAGIKAISEQAALVPQLQTQVKVLEDKLTALSKSEDEKIAEKLAPKVKPFDWGFRASTSPDTAIKADDPKDAALKTTAPSDSWVKNITPIVP